MHAWRVHASSHIYGPAAERLAILYFAIAAYRLRAAASKLLSKLQQGLSLTAKSPLQVEV